MPPPDGPASQPPSSPKRHEPDADHPQKIGKYEIQKKLGAGGMGAVYLAFDPSLKRSCALKVLPKDKASNPTLVKRFRAEARAAANLRHDNIVAVYEADEIDGHSYIAMEFVDGIDAANHVYRRGVMPEKRSIEIIRQVTQALNHASQHGIVHRDIKPANLIIRRDGAVKLADLGLARSLDEGADAGITRAGTTVGTVDYMAPEQARDSRSADVRSDIYSLGCTWYYLLTGSAPFPEGSLTNKLRAHAETPLPDPRDKNPAVTEAVVAVMRRMTEKDPERRYQSPEELARDLEDAALTRSVVSNVILDDLAEGEKRDDKSKKYSSPDQSTADIPKQPRNTPPRIRVAVERPESLRAFLFYGGLGAAAVAVLVAIGMFVRQLTVTGDAPPVQGATENPFANPAGDAPVAGSVVVNANAGAADPADAASGGNPVAPTIVMRAGQNAADAPQSSNRSPSTVSTRQPGPPQSGVDSTGANSTAVSVGGQRSGAGNDSNPARASPGNSGVVPHSASLTNRERLENARLPAWVIEDPGGGGLPTLTVRPGSVDGRHHQSLDEALAALPDQGAVILLAGDGPFPVRPVRVEKRSRIVLRSQDAAAGIAPLVVVLAAGEGSAGTGLLEFAGTSLELDGVHLAADASAFRSQATGALLHVIDGDLTLRHSSLTVRGAAAHPIAAIRLSGSKGPPGRPATGSTRLLADTVLFRGDALATLLCDREQADVVIRNSLLVSGTAPTIRISGPARMLPEPARSIRLVSTTLSAQRTAFEIADKPSQPAGAEILLLNTLVAAPIGSDTTALLSLPGWTNSDLRPGLAKSLLWRANNSASCGWKTLIRPGIDRSASAIAPDDWQVILPARESSDAFEHLTEGWPAPTAVSSGTPGIENFDARTIARLQVKTADGGRPGCAAEKLVFPDPEAIDSARVAASRRQWPDELFSDAPADDTLRVDLTREDLGDVLSRRRLRNGTRIIASGYGNRQTKPILIQGVWVRLQFQQTDGAPLVLAPRLVEVSRSSDGAQKFDAMISISQGGLEISGASFSVPNSDRVSLPRWFIQVTDGDLAMRNCRIIGPLVGTTRNKGLIQWQRDADLLNPKRPFAGSFQGYAAFHDCFFLSSGTLFDGDLRERALFLRNCVCVSRDELFQFNLRGAGSQIGAVADFQNCTFSAGDAFLRIQSSTLGSPTNSPLEIFADRCVFGPALRTGQQKPTPALLVCAPSALEQRQIRWRENHCGYAPDITQFVRGEAEPADSPPQDFERHWVSVWGADNIVAPLQGAGQVYLKDELPTKPEDRGKIDADSFRLHPSSKAAAWDAESRAIGADVAVLKAPESRPQSAPKTAAKSPAKTPAKTPKTAPKVGF